MANTISSTMMGTAAPSITQLEAREVGDEIRYLGIGNAVLTSLIENSIYQTGDRKTGKGLIGKRSVKNIRYEMFTRGYRPFKFTVASGTEVETTGLTLSDVNGLQPYMTIYNPNTNTRFRVETVNSSTKVVKGTSFGDTFSAAAGDTLVLMAPAFPEGSTESMVVNGSDDQNFNILQFQRWSVSISWVLEATKMMAGGNRFTREKMYMVWEALADQERTLLLGDYSSSYASKNTTTGAQTGYTGEFPTTRGIYALAANSYDMKGSITAEKLRKNIPLNFGDYINDNDVFMAILGNEAYARIMELVNDNVKIYQDVGTDRELAQYGLKTNTIQTSGPRLTLLKHSAFNATGLDNQMLIFNPKMLGYVFLEGHDVSPNNGIQTPATHGKQDELYSYSGIETLDAGKSIMVVTNLF